MEEKFNFEKWRPRKHQYNHNQFKELYRIKNLKKRAFKNLNRENLVFF
jgi:hypothetical protein